MCSFPESEIKFFEIDLFYAFLVIWSYVKQQYDAVLAQVFLCLFKYKLRNIQINDTRELNVEKFNK